MQSGAAGNYWILLHDMLEDEQIGTLLAHPAKTKAIAHARLKGDKVDSVLADLLRMDMVYESFVPDMVHTSKIGMWSPTHINQARIDMHGHDFHAWLAMGRDRIHARRCFLLLKIF